MARAATIHGTIDDAKTGVPVQGARICLLNLGLHAVADKLGRYEIEDVPTGTHMLEFTTDDHTTLTVELKISHTDESIVCNVFLTPIALLRTNGTEGNRIAPEQHGKIGPAQGRDDASTVDSPENAVGNTAPPTESNATHDRQDRSQSNIPIVRPPGSRTPRPTVEPR